MVFENPVCVKQMTNIRYGDFLFVHVLIYLSAGEKIERYSKKMERYPKKWKDGQIWKDILPATIGRDGLLSGASYT